MQQSFEQIRTELVRAHPEVAPGNMMRSPAISYRSKVFTFYHDHEMCFKLDDKAVYFKQQYPGSRFLSPFKNKPPMKGWLVVPVEYQKDWKLLASAAYENMVAKN